MADTYTPRGRPSQEAIGQSEPFLAFQERLSRVAQVDRPVLIVGERGTGKELAAARIHYLGSRWQEPYITLNCATLAPSLIESELFGHEVGAFTGARGARVGRFEAAHGGTLFLDEVGSIPIQAQEKVLRAVEYRSLERVGSSEPIEVDVRIVGATNADLRAMARRGTFKEDLLDRLTFEVVCVPPLRDRAEDIMLLASHFAARMARELGRDDVPEFAPDVIEALEGYPWPGNVRELKNVVERAVYQSDSARVSRVVFDPFDGPYAQRLAGPVEAPPAGQPEPAPAPAAPFEALRGRLLGEAVRDVEVFLIRDALETCRHNQRKAAEALGLTYHQFRGLYRKHRDEFAE